MHTELDQARLVFIDATRASTKMAWRCGRSEYGSLCVAAIPHGDSKTTTFLGGLRTGGMAAPMALHAPMDGPAFLAQVEQVLGPMLVSGPPEQDWQMRCVAFLAPQVEGDRMPSKPVLYRSCVSVNVDEHSVAMLDRLDR